MRQASTCAAGHHSSYDRYDFQDQAGQVSETWSWYSKKTSELLQVQEDKPPTRTVNLALVETSSASGSAVGSAVSSTTVPADTGYPDVNAHRYNYYGLKLAVSDPVDYFKGSEAAATKEMTLEEAKQFCDLQTGTTELIKNFQVCSTAGSGTTDHGHKTYDECAKLCRTTAGCEVFSLQKYPKNQIPGDKYLDKGEGLCTGNLVRVYDGEVDNPGTTVLERREACASACANKKTAVSTSPTQWDVHPGVVLGFALHTSSDTGDTGRCYCEMKVCEGLSAK